MVTRATRLCDRSADADSSSAGNKVGPDVPSSRTGYQTIVLPLYTRTTPDVNREDEVC